jgi:tetratricopeptide (TPR) repeat protein
MKLIILGLLILVSLVVNEQSSHAQAEADVGIALAAQQLERGEFEEAEKTIRRNILRPLENRAEAYRILGLSLFYQERFLEARAAFLEYLRAEPDAHLDPALVTPEAITLFEDVRARNLTEIESLRPKPKKKRYLLLNLVPGAGQFQNGDTTKGVVIAVGLGALLAANVGSYYWLKNNCDSETRVCGNADDAGASKARDYQTVNQLTGVAAIGVYAYSIIDGYLGYRAAERAENNPTRNHMRFGLLPHSGGAQVRWSLGF